MPGFHRFFVEILIPNLLSKLEKINIKQVPDKDGVTRDTSELSLATSIGTFHTKTGFTREHHTVTPMPREKSFPSRLCPQVPLRSWNGFLAPPIPKSGSYNTNGFVDRSEYQYYMM